jgi:hypothetical protein
VRDFLESGSWVWACALAVSACGAGAHDSGESEAPEARRSALELIVGAEIGTDTPALTPTDLGHNPVVASDGSGFLAVQEVDSRIRAVRVDANGKVLDATWLDLGESTEPQYYPSVAFGGGHYLVTWSAFNAQSTVRGRFVRPDGSLEGPAAFTLSNGQAMYPSVGWTGSHFLVSWLGLGDTESHVTVAAFEPNGTPISNSEHAVSSAGAAVYPRIAVGSSRALVTWPKFSHSDELGDTSRIYGALVDLSGTPVGNGEFALSDSASSEMTVSVASSGSHFLVVWETRDDVSSVVGSSINDSGAFDHEDMTISRSSEATGLASVAFDGSKYLVAWADARDQQSVYGTPVSATGDVLGTADVKLANGSPRYVGGGSDGTALAWSGSKYLLSFLGNGIEGSLIAPDLQVQNGQIALTAVPSSQGYPNLVWNGVDYVVQWTDERESWSNMSLRALRIDPTGRVRDPDGIVLSTAESPAFGASLGSTGNGSALSLWTGDGGANYRRTLAADGTLGPLSAFGATPLFSPAAVASNGSGYLAVYMTGDSSDGAVFGRLLDLGGAGGSEFRIDTSTVNTGPNVFAGPGGGYLVSYSNGGTRVLSVSASGQLGTSHELSPSTGLVSAASGANETLVTWTDSDTQIRARFFASNALSAETLVLAESSAGYRVALSWEGSSYFAIWETAEHHLDGRSIANDGTLGPITTLVDEPCYGPVSASNQQGQLLVSYIKYSANYRSRRIASRLIGTVAGSAGSGGSAGGVGSSGSVGGAGSSGSVGSSGASGSSTGSGGAIGTAGSGTPGGTAGSSVPGGGGGSQPPVIFKCSLTNAGNQQASGSAAVSFGFLLAGLASVFARRRRRASAT